MATDSNATPIRRKFPRKSFRKSISYLAGGQGELVEGVEIGEGGISFRSKTKIELSQKVILNFFIPEGDFFSVVITLKNAHESNGEFVYGTSFDEVSTSLKRQVRAYVARTLTSASAF